MVALKKFEGWKRDCRKQRPPKIEYVIRLGPATKCKLSLSLERLLDQKLMKGTSALYLVNFKRK